MFEPMLVEGFLHIIQQCRKEKTLENARNVFNRICGNGLESHKVLGNYMIPMLVDCGCMSEAQQIFRKLGDPNEHSWTSLIQGYIGYGDFHTALHVFHNMEKVHVYPSSFTLQAALKCCANLKYSSQGQEIHANLVIKGLDEDPFLCSGLIDMYSKCCIFEEAYRVLLDMPFRDVVSWNSIISGYAERGYVKEVLECIQNMQLEGVSPSAITFACTMKGCGNIGALNYGQDIHTEILNRGFERDSFMNEILLYMYLKCGSISEAADIFLTVQVKNVVFWTSFIAGHVEFGCDEKALSFLEDMRLNGISPNEVTYVCCLKACGNGGGNAKKLQELHVDITKQGFEKDTFIQNALVDVYGRFGLLLDARNLFDEVSDRDVVTWNALISGYIEHGHHEEALNLSSYMYDEGILPNASSYILSLKACCHLENQQKGQEIHIQIAKKEQLEEDNSLGTSLIDMYMKHGAFEEACHVFYEQKVRTVVSWTLLIAGYAEQGFITEIHNSIQQMQLDGISPNAVTLTCCFKACTLSGCMDLGRESHNMVIKLGFDQDTFVGNHIIDMYAKCGSLQEEGNKVFELLSIRDDMSWGVIIAAYAEQGLAEDAFTCLEQMQDEGMMSTTNTRISVSILKACNTSGSIQWGRKVHTDCTKMGTDKEISVSTALVVMYTNCCSIIEAEICFTKSSLHNVVSWTALITGYVEQGYCEKALRCLGMMAHEGISPNAITLLSILKASSNNRDIKAGQGTHIELVKKGHEADGIIRNSLVDMYAKCGNLTEAHDELERLPDRSIVTWTTLITGYASYGDKSNVMYLLEKMEQEGVECDGVIMLSILTACAHIGLVDEAVILFHVVNMDPKVGSFFDHYSSIIDCLARAGQLETAIMMMNQMPFQPNLVVWTTMLGACRNWGHIGLGRQAFEFANGFNEKQSSTFLLMLNIYYTKCTDTLVNIEAL